jgi:hypothetical protein
VGDYLHKKIEVLITELGGVNLRNFKKNKRMDVWGGDAYKITDKVCLAKFGQVEKSTL